MLAMGSSASTLGGESRWGGDKPIQAAGYILIWLPISRWTGHYVAPSTSSNLECNIPLPILDCEHCVSRNEHNLKNNSISKLNQLWTQIKLYFVKPTAWAVFIAGALLLVTASGTR